MPLHPVQLTPQLMNYCTDVNLGNNAVNAVLAALRQETATLTMAEMQIDPVQGQFLQFLVRSIQAKKTLDIGVFTGYSSLVVAQALPDAGQVIACDTSEEWTNIAKRYWQQAGVANKIILKLAPATETIADLINQGQGGTFDFAFIDADKAAYDSYYEQCLELCRSGGMIVLDNMLDAGKVADQTIQTERVNRFRALNHKVSQDDRVSYCLLPVADGMLLVLKK